MATRASSRSAEKGSAPAAKRVSSRRKNRPSPRLRLLASATELFTTEGIRVIGIDRILREADVAKASLYSLYGSKDNLVIAYIQALDAQWREEWEQATADYITPVEKLLGFFQKARDDQPGNNFRGSHFQNAATEYPCPETDSERGILEAVAEHRRWLRDTMTQLLTEHNGYPSENLGEQVLLLFDGGLAGVKHTRDCSPLHRAEDMVRALISTPVANYSI